MLRHIRLTEMTTELLRLRDEYEDLAVATVSSSVSTYEATHRALKAIDELIDEHEDLVQVQRRFARS